MFERVCARYPDNPAIHNWGTTFTYAELERQTQAFAGYLMASGFKKGDRIALMMPNLLQYPVALFGALRAGLAVVNTNPLYTARELAYQLKDSGATCIVVLANFAHVVETVLSETSVRTVIITELGDLLRFPKGSVVNVAARRFKKLVPKFHLPYAVPFKTALRLGSRAELQPPDVFASDLAFLQYTGGTTGVPKGAMLSHANMVANLEQLSEAWKDIIVEGKEIMITPLPLYHVFSLTCALLTFTRHAGLNVLITNPRDTAGFMSELKHWQFTFITGVTSLYRVLMEHPRFAQLDFSALKLGVAGGMALQRDVADRWQSMTGRPMIEGYGLTECSPVVACNVIGAAKLGTVGLPLPGTDVSLRDDDVVANAGETGELCVRGPQVMRGYWNNPKESATAFTADGWLRTGDIASLDAEGYLTIVDRKKDMIIVGGFKVFPSEIEGVIAAHPAIAEVGCVGVPDERAGQAIKACIVLRAQESVSPEELREFCRTSLTAYKVPKLIEFRDSLPKTNIGKVLRRALLQQTATPPYAESTLSAH
jgi:long-chain acyl-CoA synthetase